MRQLLLQVDLRTGQDVVSTRQLARHLARSLGFDAQTQVRLATAVSEVARLAAGASGRLEFLLEDGPSAALLIRVWASATPEEGLVSCRAPDGLRPGPALAPAQRLMDRVELRSLEDGRVELEMVQLVPRALPAPSALETLRAELERQRRANAADELGRQNEELLETLGELQARKAEVDRLNRELEETNRGVVALYAELEEKAEALRRASDMKTRFISNVSHELRTPISSILTLSRLLLDRIDGPLNTEQEKQVLFVRKSGEALQELIDDLLDLAKIEAGRVDVQSTTFTVGELFGALRGMLRPLRVNEGVSLVFEEPEALPALHTDERKLSQILRNLVSNALKFTPQGEVRVSVAPGPKDTVVFSVRDSGVGIAPEDQERIFEEFVQVEGPHQRGVQGTGLGLPLSRQLAELLGGSLTVESQPGEGSTFSAVVARDYIRREVPSGEEEASSQSLEPGTGHLRTVLIIDDDEVARYLLQRLLAEASLQFREAATGTEGVRMAGELLPAAILLDISLPGLNGFEVVEALRREPATRKIPVVIHTSHSLTEQERERLSPHVVGFLPKSGLTREAALELLHLALSEAGAPSGRVPSSM